VTHAPIEVEIVPPEEVLALRDLYRQEMNCQIIHDSWHARRWCDCYLLRVADRVAGYGFVGAIKTAPELRSLPDPDSANAVMTNGANRL